MDSLVAFLNLRRNADELTEDDGEDDGGDSFFDLVLESPQRKELLGKAADVVVRKGPSSPVTVLAPQNKARVFTFGFRRSTSSDSASDAGEVKASPLSKVLLLKPSKCRAVFARGNSLRSEMLNPNENDAPNDVASSGRPFPKYLKLMKPFYSKKSKPTDSVTPPSAPANSSRRKLYHESSRIANFKVAAATGLGRIRSASTVPCGPLQPQIRRRDDTLLEQHDGIQGAILYCKKSYNSSAPSSTETSHLTRSASDPSREKDTTPCLDLKRCSI